MLRLTYSAAFLTLVLAACSNGDHNNSPDAGGVVDAPGPRCGDGVVDGNEQCDDGNTVSGDGCSATCTTEFNSKCGNGQLDGNEQCDDGNTASGDGCSADCSVETGYDCVGSPSLCTAVTPVLCGNGALDPDEQCDAGTAANAYCTATCQLRWDVTEIPGNNDVTYRAQMLDPVDQVIEGSLPAGDLDLYTFTLTAPSVVSFETYGDFAAGTLHCLGTDTQLYLFANGTDVTTNDAAMMGNDDSADDAPCSLVGGTLPAGTYFLKIDLASSTASAAQYLIAMHVAAQM